MNAAWLVRLERLCAALGASMVSQLMAGEPQDSEEKDNAQCLRSPLLLYAVINSESEKLVDRESAAALGDSVTSQFSEDHVKQTDCEMSHGQGGDGNGCVGARGFSHHFMMHLCSHSGSKESRALSVVMRRVVLEDRGHDQGTNEAIWAAAVAAVHHAGLEGEVARIVRSTLAESNNNAGGAIDARNGVPVTVSPALIRAWRCVQQARFRLEGGVLRDRERIRVMRRAQFLVSLKPWASSIHEGVVESDSGEVVLRALKASELVLHFLLRTVERTDTQFGGGGSGGGDGAMVDAEPRTTAREGDPDALLRTVKAQSVRAVARSRGFSLAAQLLNRRYSNRSAIEILRSVTDGLAMRCLGQALASCMGEDAQAAGGIPVVSGEVGGLENAPNAPRRQKRADSGELFDPGRLHFMVGVECCDTRARSVLADSVAQFLRQCFLVLEKIHMTDQSTTAGINGGHHAVVVQALRAVSMDYGVDDHGILYHSQLLPLILTLVDHAEPSVSEAASVALQALGRCALLERTRDDGAAFLHGSMADGLEGGRGLRELAGDESHGSQPRKQTPKRDGRASCTPFQTAFFGTVGLKVQEIAGTSGEKLATLRSTTKASPSIPPAGRELLEALLPLHSDQAGMVVPHFTLGVRHTLSLWVCIPPSVAASTLACNRDLGDCEVPSIPAGQPQETHTSYIVVEQESCVVRRTPSLSSERIGVLNAGEVIEVLPPEPQWERHPLVLGGRRVRVSWPMKGYASLHTAEGSKILEPVSMPWRRRASDGDLGGSAEGISPPCPVGGTSRRPREQEGRSVRTREFTPAFGGAVSGEQQDEQETRARSAEPPPRRSAGLMARGGPFDVKRSGAATPPPKRESFVGGILLFKGNEALLGDDETSCSWNRMGIEVTPAGALRFFVGEGGPSEAAVTSRDHVLLGAGSDTEGGGGRRNSAGGSRMVAPGWYHIAVVQDQLDVALFVNGRQCGAGCLPQHLRRPPMRRNQKDDGGLESSCTTPRGRRLPSTTVQFNSESKAPYGNNIGRFPADLAGTQVGFVFTSGYPCDRLRQTGKQDLPIQNKTTFRKSEVVMDGPYYRRQLP